MGKHGGWRVNDVVAIGRPGVAAELEQYLRGESNAPTAERVARAIANGDDVEVRGEGRDAQWRVSPPLHSLLQRGTILQEELRAAERFLKEYYLGHYAGPKTSGFRERTGRSHSDFGREDHRVHYARETRKAIDAVPDYFHPALAWMIGVTFGEGMPLQALGAHYRSDLGKQVQSTRGGQTLSFACIALCRHYGIQHRMQTQIASDLELLFRTQFKLQVVT